MNFVFTTRSFSRQIKAGKKELYRRRLWRSTCHCHKLKDVEAEMSELSWKSPVLWGLGETHLGWNLGLHRTCAGLIAHLWTWWSVGGPCQVSATVKIAVKVTRYLDSRRHGSWLAWTYRWVGKVGKYSSIDWFDCWSIGFVKNTPPVWRACACGQFHLQKMPNWNTCLPMLDVQVRLELA